MRKVKMCLDLNPKIYFRIHCVSFVLTITCFCILFLSLFVPSRKLNLLQDNASFTSKDADCWYLPINIIEEEIFTEGVFAEIVTEEDIID